MKKYLKKLVRWLTLILMSIVVAIILTGFLLNEGATKKLRFLMGLFVIIYTIFFIKYLGIGMWKTRGSHRAKIFPWKKVSNITVNKDKKKIVVYKK